MLTNQNASTREQTQQPCEYPTLVTISTPDVSYAITCDFATSDPELGDRIHNRLLSVLQRDFGENMTDKPVLNADLDQLDRFRDDMGNVEVSQERHAFFRFVDAQKYEKKLAEKEKLMAEKDGVINRLEAKVVKLVRALVVDELSGDDEEGTQEQSQQDDQQQVTELILNLVRSGPTTPITSASVPQVRFSAEKIPTVSGHPMAASSDAPATIVEDVNPNVDRMEPVQTSLASIGFSESRISTRAVKNVDISSGSPLSSKRASLSTIENSQKNDLNSQQNASTTGASLKPQNYHSMDGQHTPQAPVNQWLAIIDLSSSDPKLSVSDSATISEKVNADLTADVRRASMSFQEITAPKPDEQSASSAPDASVVNKLPPAGNSCAETLPLIGAGARLGSLESIQFVPVQQLEQGYQPEVPKDSLDLLDVFQQKQVQNPDGAGEGELDQQAAQVFLSGELDQEAPYVSDEFIDDGVENPLAPKLPKLYKLVRKGQLRRSSSSAAERPTPQRFTTDSDASTDLGAVGPLKKFAPHNRVGADQWRWRFARSSVSNVTELLQRHRQEAVLNTTPHDDAAADEDDKSMSLRNAYRSCTNSQHPDINPFFVAGQKKVGHVRNFGQDEYGTIFTTSAGIPEDTAALQSQPTADVLPSIPVKNIAGMRNLDYRSFNESFTTDSVENDSKRNSGNDPLALLRLDKPDGSGKLPHGFRLYKDEYKYRSFSKVLNQRGHGQKEYYLGAAAPGGATTPRPSQPTRNRGESGVLGQVEEKFEKYFGYLARCEENFRTTTLKN